jgi:curli biogenesis system outer membrane secretion channel CsgG
MIMKFKVLITTFLLFSFFGCGHSYNRFFVGWPEGINRMKSVAVMPFENLTSFPNAGEIVSELFTAELYTSGRFKVLESEQIKRILDEKGIELPRVIDRSFAQEIGAILGVDGVFIGSVSEYWYRIRMEETREEEPAVGFNVRLVDVKTGAVVWASSCSRSSYSAFVYQRDSLNRVAQIIAEKMVKKLLAAAEIE